MKSNSLRSLAVLFAVALAASACKEEYNGPEYSAGPTPAPVTQVVATPMPGGADITYSVPEDKDLLYVEADISVPSGRTFNVKSSSYGNVIEIRGLASTDPQQVMLYSVNKGGVRSEGCPVTINPLTPPYMNVYASLKMKADFGGVNVSFANESNASLAIVLSYLDEKSNEYLEYDTYSTEESDGNSSFRGMENETRKFSLYIRDRWDNISPTVEAELTPLYEEQIDKSKFKAVTGIQGDGKGDGTYATDGQSQPAFMWNGVWPTALTNYGDYKMFYIRSYDRQTSFTLDMGQAVQLSRMRFNYYYKWTYMEPKEYEVYGCTELTEDMYDGEWSKWTLLAHCTFDKPSGLGDNEFGPGDAEAFVAGTNIDVDIQMPRIRYIRVKGIECWDGGSSLCFSEITAWGDPRQ